MSPPSISCAASKGSISSINCVRSVPAPVAIYLNPLNRISFYFKKYSASKKRRARRSRLDRRGADLGHRTRPSPSGAPLHGGAHLTKPADPLLDRRVGGE